MRLREQQTARHSQPETHGCNHQGLNKYFLVSSPAVRLASGGQIQLTQALQAWVSLDLMPPEGPYPTGSDGAGRTVPSCTWPVYGRSVRQVKPRPRLTPRPHLNLIYTLVYIYVGTRMDTLYLRYLTVPYI